MYLLYPQQPTIAAVAFHDIAMKHSTISIKGVFVSFILEGKGGKGRGLKSIIYLILMVSHLHYHKNSEQKIARCRLEQSYPMGYAAWIHVGTDTAAILVSLPPCVGAYNQPHITNAFIMNHSIVAAGYHFT